MWFITLVVRNLWHRKVRTLLTCLGMGVAVCAVVTMIGVADVFEQAVARLLETRGVDLVVTRAGVAQRVASTLPAALRERFLQVPGVRAVEPLLVDVVSFEEANLIAVYVLGWDINGHMFDELRFQSGRKPLPGDDHPVVLGTTLAQSLGKGVGGRVTIEGEEFHVVGVHESYNLFENSSAIVGLADLQKLMDRRAQVTAYLLVVEEAPDKKQAVEAVRERLEELTDERGRKLGITARATRDHIASTLELRVVRAMAWATSVIALVIGVISTLNTMMISVFERTREIGTLGAVGWTKTRVVGMILLESLILCGAGWVLGLLGSLLLTWLLSVSPTTSALILPSRVAPWIMAEALVLVLLAGLLGAAYPAFFAARLTPTEALRHE
jgi:putative ABC transport system permease protein